MFYHLVVEVVAFLHIVYQKRFDKYICGELSQDALAKFL
jgi:hypothetical protein